MTASLAVLEAADDLYGYSLCGCLRSVVATSGHGCVLASLPGVWTPGEPSGLWGPVPTPDGVVYGGAWGDTLRTA